MRPFMDNLDQGFPIQTWGTCTSTGTFACLKCFVHFSVRWSWILLLSANCCLSQYQKVCESRIGFS